MNETNNRITIRVWGNYACFTRPEMKVERVSYPVCTPSAARGILEAIYWEPQMYYVIDNIAVVKKGRWFTFRRNEVTSVINISQAHSWMLGKTPVKYVSAGGGAPDAAQRNMLGLADVEYLITAEIRPSGLYNASRNDKGKYLREIRDRALKGKCFHRPALGCREFAADFDYVEDAEKVRLADWKEEDLGLMLYDVFDANQRAEGFRWLAEDERKALAADPTPLYEGEIAEPQVSFFHAKVQEARLDCHPDRVKILRPMGKEVN